MASQYDWTINAYRPHTLDNKCWCTKEGKTAEWAVRCVMVRYLEEATQNPQEIQETSRVC